MTPFYFRAHPTPPVKGDVVIPANLMRKADLFRFLAHALPLPDYFGHNWDALEECLGECGGPKIALVHQDIPLANLPAEQRIYLQILAGVASAPSRMNVIFPEMFRTQIQSLFSPPHSSR
jgi:RNAse (barnase) inhibitor barstar